MSTNIEDEDVYIDGNITLQRGIVNFSDGQLDTLIAHCSDRIKRLTNSVTPGTLPEADKKRWPQILDYRQQLKIAWDEQARRAAVAAQIASDEQVKRDIAATVIAVIGEPEQAITELTSDEVDELIDHERNTWRAEQARRMAAQRLVKYHPVIERGGLACPSKYKYPKHLSVYKGGYLLPGWRARTATWCFCNQRISATEAQFIADHLPECVLDLVLAAADDANSAVFAIGDKVIQP